MSVLRSPGFSALCCPHRGTSGVSAFWNIDFNLWYKRQNMMDGTSAFRGSIHHFSSQLTAQAGSVTTPSWGICGIGKYIPSIIWKEETQKCYCTSVLTLR